MNRLECVGKSPKYSPTAMGQLEIISAGVLDGVQFLEGRSRKESTEQVVKEHAHGRLPVVGCEEPIPSEAVGSTSRSCSSGFQPKYVRRGSVSPTKHVDLSAPKVCLSSSGFPLNSSGRGSNSPTRRIDWSEPKVHPNRIVEGPPIADRQVLMTAIKIKPKWSPPKTASTEDLSQFRQDTSTAESLISHKERRGNPVSVGQARSGSSQPTVSIVSMDECTEEEDGSDDVAHRAPLQLFAEFLSSVMGKDYVLASKLCQMILIYEPENPEAKQFIPLIEEKLLLEQAEDQQEENRDSGAESNTEDSGDSSCIDSDSDSEGSSDHSSSSSEEEEEERARDHRGCHPAFVPS